MNRNQALAILSEMSFTQSDGWWVSQLEKKAEKLIRIDPKARSIEIDPKNLEKFCIEVAISTLRSFANRLAAAGDEVYFHDEHMGDNEVIKISSSRPLGWRSGMYNYPASNPVEKTNIPSCPDLG